MTKRDYGDGSVYQRQSDGRFVATLRAGGKRLYFYGDTKPEALQKLKKARKEHEQGALATSGATLTVSQHLVYWLEVHGSKVREKTRSRYRRVLQRVSPIIGHVKLQKLTTDQIQRLYGQLQQEGMSPNTIRTTHTVFSTALKAAIKWRRLSYNPCKDVTLPRAIPRNIPFLTVEQAHQLMHTAQGSPLECMIALAVTTGMRKGELLGLQWSDINWDQQTLQVKRTVTYLQEDGSKARFIETEPKTASSKRTIILPPFVIDLLRSHRARQSQVRWKIGSSWRNQDLVFTNSRGGHYYIGVLHQQYEKLLDVAGLPRMRFHDLRHSAATILLSLGVNIKVIQELLGHSNIQITLNTYGHVIPGMQKQAMHSLDMLYKQAQEPPRQLDVKLATF